ncbi:hypothetical protein, partial [Tatumella sp. OPLPL6]|uniref:hypothetical protein n=1 Tax=Tatumella sp. OPLPL6 TaxID=1928657 RepID=UPI000C579718
MLGIIFVIKFVLISIGKEINQGVMAWFNLATNPIILEFISGYLVAYFFKSTVYLVNRVRYPVFILAIFILLILIYFEMSTFYFYSDFHIGGMFLPALFIFFFCIKIFDLDKKAVPRFLIFTSRISYSIYLLHMAIIFTIIDISTWFFGSDVFGVFSARFNLFFISLFFSWVISYYFCFYIE